MEFCFNPSGIAVAGASADPAKPGHQVLHNLLEAGYPGPLYAINPKATEILGVKAFPDLAQVPAPLEMLVLALPAQTTPAMIEAIRERVQQKGDLKVVVAIAGGFAETGLPEGRQWQSSLAEACRQVGVRLIGPNCIGVIDNRHQVDTTFLTGVERSVSGISVLSQSGAMGAWMFLEWGGWPVPVGLNKFISLGNMADVTMTEVMDTLGEDPSTRAVGLYLEGASQARPLLEAAARVARQKPVVALKVGRTGQGSDAAKSHTGALAGADQIYDGAFRQYGLIRANRLDDFTVMLRAFDRLPLPNGARVAVVTNAGGPGVYSLDALSDQGLALGRFSDETKAALATILPPFASIGHPDGHVDTTGGVVPSQVARTVATILRDPGIDAVIHLFIPTKFTPAVETAQELLNLLPEVRQNGPDKPLFPVFMSGKGVEEARQLLEENGLPSFGSPDQVAATLAAMVRYSRERQQAATAAMTAPESVSALPVLERLTATCRAEKRTQLTEWETYEALQAFQIPVAPSRLVATPAEAAEAAKALGGRVAVKIVSPDIGHKTDAGCVRLGLTNPEAAAAAAAEILANAHRYKADAAIHGLLVQQMAAPGVEIIAGGLADATFGPVLMVGLGGIFTEVLKDVAFRLAPIAPAEAETMLRGLQGFPLLTGVRGRPPVALAPLTQAIANLSRLLAAWPELKELDLNPLIATPEGVMAVDGLATLRS